MQPRRERGDGGKKEGNNYPYPQNVHKMGIMSHSLMGLQLLMLSVLYLTN